MERTLHDLCEEKRVKNLSIGGVLRFLAATLHRYLDAQRGRFSFLLLLLVSMSCRTMAQTPQPYRASVPSSLATEEALPLPMWSGMKIARLANRDVVRGVGRNVPRVIVIGFVGGFARHDDQKHPEVQFAKSLQEHYRSAIHAEVFANHDGREALHEVMRLLDTNGNGTLSPAEKRHAKIVIYGHSWGAAETIVLARQLGARDIPVSLTIQVDSIAKPGRNDSTIPANVAKAINFYQSGGPLHGRPYIVAADPDQTKIIGNLHMSYKDHHIKCDNYPWFARTFNKPHHEIENDPRVWDQASHLIDSEVAGAGLKTQESE